MNITRKLKLKTNDVNVYDSCKGIPAAVVFTICSRYNTAKEKSQGQVVLGRGYYFPNLAHI